MSAPPTHLAAARPVASLPFATDPTIHDSDHAALRSAAETPGAALCTIVGIDGSFSRRLGAQLAILPGGTVVGSLADGCLEAELARQADRGRAAGKPALLRYGAGSPIIDFRLPCGSGLDVLIDPAPERAALARAVAALDARQPATVPLPAAAGSSAAHLAVRRYIPSLRLALIGTGPERAALARLARSHGLRVDLAGPAEGLGLGSIPTAIAPDPWTALILLFHDHEWETALVDWALRGPALYLGAQGGKAAREARRERLAALGHDAPALARLRSPVGLIPHARDADTLALSILADVVAIYEAQRG